jgi:hypothetical protein
MPRVKAAKPPAASVMPALVDVRPRGVNIGISNANGGRPVGSNPVRSSKAAAELLKEGITPLEVMIHTMRDFWHGGDQIAAFNCAVAIAPYCHARLSSITAQVDVNPVTLADFK